MQFGELRPDPFNGIGRISGLGGISAAGGLSRLVGHGWSLAACGHSLGDFEMPDQVGDSG